MKEIFRLSIWY